MPKNQAFQTVQCVVNFPLDIEMTEGKSFFAKMSKYQIMCGLESLSSKILIDMESKEQTFNGQQMKGEKIKDVGTEFAEACLQQETLQKAPFTTDLGPNVRDKSNLNENMNLMMREVDLLACKFNDFSSRK